MYVILQVCLSLITLYPTVCLLIYITLLALLMVVAYRAKVTYRTKPAIFSRGALRLALVASPH